MAQKILARVQELSKPFGTTITIENNVGVIRVNRTGTPARDRQAQTLTVAEAARRAACDSRCPCEHKNANLWCR